jgi:hypothetical protein
MGPRKAEKKKGDDEHLEISAVQPVKITGGDRSAVSQFCWILTTPKKVSLHFTREKRGLMRGVVVVCVLQDWDDPYRYSQVRRPRLGSRERRGA